MSRNNGGRAGARRPGGTRQAIRLAAGSVRPAADVRLLTGTAGTAVAATGVRPGPGGVVRAVFDVPLDARAAVPTGIGATGPARPGGCTAGTTQPKPPTHRTAIQEGTS